MNLNKLSLGVVAAILLSSCGSKKEDTANTKELPSYPTTVIKLSEAELQNVYPTTIKGKEDIQIKPRVGGFIENLYIDEGSVVTKGQVLFTINSPESEQAVQAARAVLNSAQAQVNTAEVNVVRFRSLAEKNIVSNVQLKTYENAYAQAQASLAQAQASLTQAQASLSWTRVTSPANGVVGSISYRQGALVTSADVVTTVANTGNVYAYFSINEKQLMGLLSQMKGNTQAEKIKNMPPITLKLANGDVYPELGKVETISGLVNTNTGSVDLRAEFPNKSGILRSGSSGTVIMPKVVEDVFVIPQKSTFSQLNKTLVYKVQGDSVVQAIIDVTPLPGGQDYAVTDGLKVGDRIVTEGVTTLSNGKKIKVTE